MNRKDRQIIAGELVKVARDLVGGYEEDYDKLHKYIDDLLKTEMKKLDKKYENHPDFSERPNETTMKLREEIMESLRKYGYRVGMGRYGNINIYPEGEEDKVLNFISDILKRYRVKIPSNVWDYLKWKDADGVTFIHLN
jgi:hypothetical protein